MAQGNLGHKPRRISCLWLASSARGANQSTDGAQFENLAALSDAYRFQARAFVAIDRRESNCFPRNLRRHAPAACNQWHGHNHCDGGTPSQRVLLLSGCRSRQSDLASTTGRPEPAPNPQLASCLLLSLYNVTYDVERLPSFHLHLARTKVR